MHSHGCNRVPLADTVAATTHPRDSYVVTSDPATALLFYFHTTARASEARECDLAWKIFGLFGRPPPSFFTDSAEPDTAHSDYEMVQTYGVAEEHDVAQDDGRSMLVQGGESSALLGADAAPKGVRAQLDGKAGLTSSVGNLANTIIGSGMFSLMHGLRWCLIYYL